MTTILYIDDGDADRLALARMLRATGLHVREAATGREGLLLAAEKPDLILLNVHLPDADGVEVCRTLKQEPATAGIPVLLLSGEQVRSEDRVHGLDGGADGCLPRRVAVDELLAHIRALLRASRAEQALRVSENRFRAIIEKGFEAVVILATDGAIRYVSPACTAVMGFPREELVGRDGFWFVHPDDLVAALANIQQLLETPGTTTNTVLRCLHKDGSYRWIQSRGSNLLDEPGVEGLVFNFNDVTQRKRSEEALQESERFLRTTLDALSAHIAILDESGAVVAVNAAWRAFARANGLDPSRVDVGVNYLAVCDSVTRGDRETAQQVARGIRDILAGRREDYYLEYPCHSAQEQRWFAMRVRPFGPGRPNHVVVAHEDVTVRKKAEDQVRESEQRIRAIVNSAPDSILTIDERGVIESVNPVTERMFGYSAGELIGRNVSMLMPSPFREEHEAYLANYLRTGVSRVIGTVREVQGRRKDGATFPVELAVSEFRVGGRRLFAGVHHDVSQRKAMEREILEIAAQEQRRLGQDLHDGTGQELTGLSLMAESLMEALAEQDSPEVGLAAKVAQGLKRALSQVRALSRGLVPVEVDARGLMAALEELAVRVSEQTGAACVLHCQHPVHVEDNLTATQLYRIAQEAVTNALKHGQARHIHISLDTEGRLVRLRIRDDGVGISDQQAESRGVGLRIMRYRAGLINARLSIAPAEGGGTIVSCTFITDHKPEAPARGRSSP